MRARGLLSALGPLVGLLLVLVLAAVTTPSFYSRGVFEQIALQIGLIGITALGQTLVLLVGGIDLSIGAVMGLTSVLVATVTGGRDGDLAGAIVLAVLAGIAVGAVNAFLVLVRQVPPFVATFATFVMVQGIITAWTNGAPSGAIPGALRHLGTGHLLGLPVPAWLFVVLAVVIGLVLAGTVAGRRVYATGANPAAARLSGIRTAGVIAGCYVLSSLLGVLAGLVNAGYIGYVDSQLSRTLNLDSVAAAVIGGIALTGGRGRIAQTAGGVILLATLLTWLIQLGAGAGAQYAVEGAVIVLAVWLQHRPLPKLLRRGAPLTPTPPVKEAA